MNGFFSFLLGWLIILGLLWGGAKFEATRVVIYYVLWLNIILVIVTHSQELSNLISGAGINTQQELAPGKGVL